MKMAFLNRQDPNKKNKRSLPSGWRWAILGEIGRFESGGTPSKENANYWGGSIPFVTGADITELEISAKHARAFLTEAGLSSGKTAVCSKGTVLIVTRTRVGRVGVATETMGASQDLSPFICGPEILPEYASRYLLNISNYLLENCRGATVQGLARDFIHSLYIPLPSLAKQREIIEILNEQMAALERARTAVEAQLETAKLLPAAYLCQAFYDRKKWPTQKIAQLATIVRGSSPRPKSDPRYYGGRVPRLMVEDVTRDGMHVIPKIDFLTDEGSGLSRPMKKGDVVIVVSGAPGLPAILGVDACIHDGFVGLKNLQTDKIMAEFLFYFLKFSKDTTDIQATGAIFRNLTTDQIGEIVVPLPRLAEQQRIVAELSERMVGVEKVRFAVEAQLNEINALPAVLLHQAFAGEI